ncbi:heme ABC transporter ATP-binding protein [Gemmobacter denitrificans]|uniref:Heme ABC transporter ATP-binding protein n=1 Tax=Gemmobacter denitrificans TaxID=3123040 RepID=A0ABU8C116_9RHOB
MLEARGLHLRHGPRSLVRDLQVSARPGQVTAIVGPNGAGKTTLLRSLTGELDMGGTVTLNGLPVRGTPPARMAAMRAVMPQSVRLAFAFTVAEVVRMGAEAGLSATTPGLTEAALQAVGLPGFGPRVVSTLSGGEQARVQLARALAQVWQPVGPSGSHWLMLDEPVASLDIGQQLQVMRLARSFADRGGGVIAVLHDLNLTAMFADHVLLLSPAGAQQGPAAQVLTDTALSAAYACPLRLGRAPAEGLFLLPQMAGYEIPNPVDRFCQKS